MKTVRVKILNEGLGAREIIRVKILNEGFYEDWRLKGEKKRVNY